MIKLNWIEEKQWPPRVCPATTNSVKIKHWLDWIGNWIRVELYCSFMHYTKYNSEPRKQHYLVYWSSASNGTIRLPSTWRIEVQLSIAATQFQYASAVVHHLMYWSVASIGSNTTTACLSSSMFCCCFVWCFVVVLFDVYVAARCHAAARRCCPPFAHQIWCVNLRGPRWLRRREEGQRIRGVLGAVRGGPRPVLGWSWGFPGTPLGPPKAVRKLLEIF